jgi:hypothetical protein
MCNIKNILFILIIPFVLFLYTGCTNQKKLPSACKEKPAAGNCKAAFQCYYYNSKTKKCEMFIWGGCAGNVPFRTLEECQKQCGCK